MGGVAFKDTVVTPPKLPALKESGISAFGSVPCLSHGGVNLVQWQAVAMYAADVALNAGALTPIQRAQDLMLCGTYEDVLSANIRASPGGGGDPAQRGAAVAALVSKFFPPLEAMLPAEGWLHGGPTPSLGDLAIFAIMSYRTLIQSMGQQEAGRRFVALDGQRRFRSCAHVGIVYARCHS